MTTSTDPLQTTSPTRKLPELKGYPLLGCLPDFGRDPLELFLRMARQGDACATRFGVLPCIMFNRPEHVQSVLVEHAKAFDKGEAVHSVFRPIIGDGIFSSEGEFHRSQRSIMAPAFHPGPIAQYAEGMAKYAEQIQSSWADGATIDLNQQMTALSLNIIGKALYDADSFSESDEIAAATLAVTEYLSHAFTTLFRLPYSWPLPRNRRTRRAVEVIRMAIGRLIAERRTAAVMRRDFLSMLLNARNEEGEPMDDEQVMAECLTLFGAGHETSATALTWSWFLLCNHPDKYRKLQDEVDSVLQGRAPTHADLVRLPYALQVFKEAMRLYPPAHAMARRALHEVVVDGYVVPKNAIVLLSPYTLHRREEFYPDPERFEPERFQPEREKQLPRHAYLPFGAGARSCIGRHFAMTEGHVALAAIAQRVEFTLVPGQTVLPDPRNNPSLRPGGAVNVTVKRRAAAAQAEASARTAAAQAGATRSLSL